LRNFSGQLGIETAATASETGVERQQPTPSRLREQLEEAGWPTFDDG
jgi:hypothetical protein